LIALHQTTHSENFADVMTREFETLPDEDTRYLCVIAGIATLARVGVGLEIASAVYATRGKRSFKSALDALAGIVEINADNRLVARHELYVRHLLENVIPLSEFLDVVSEILSQFAKFEIPVIRRINRTDGYLFKYILNNEFIFRLCKMRGNVDAGRSVYEQFELDFQLDGHFWLQYGLYLVKMHNYEEALKMLSRSIEAYPQNPYARHALAHLQLRIASHRRAFDSATENLISRP
jgi:tetratricopeptide (TPR) repeat protein